MTGNELNELYGAIIAPTAEVSIPDAWLPAIHDALAALRDDRRGAGIHSESGKA